MSNKKRGNNQIRSRSSVPNTNVTDSPVTPSQSKGIWHSIRPYVWIVVACLILVLLWFDYVKPARDSKIGYVFFNSVFISAPALSDKTDVLRIEVLDKVNHILDEPPGKIAKMLESEVESSSIGLGLSDSHNKQFLFNQISGFSINNDKFFRLFREWFGKNDFSVDLQMEAPKDSLITEVSVYPINEKQPHHKARISKHFFNSTDQERVYHETLQEVAAHVVFLIDPYSAILSDYEKGNIVDFYQTVNPWTGNAFSNREEILENAPGDLPFSDYRNLFLANIKASFGQQNMDKPTIREAIRYYKQFLDIKSDYQDQVEYKIQALERLLDSPRPDLLKYVLRQQRTGDSRQLIVVTAKNGSQGLMCCYQKDTSGRWSIWKDSIAVHLGYNGLAEKGKKREGDGKTPSGYYPITRVFGIEENIETKMPFKVITVNHVWVTDTTDVENYNKLIYDDTGRYKNNKNEFLLSENTQELNKYGIPIDYNMKRTPGKGSAIYIHIERQKGTFKRTAGCISMKEEDLISIIEWLNPEEKPHIWIGKAPN